MADNPLLIKLRTMARAVWHFIVRCFRNMASSTTGDWRKLFKTLHRIWENKDIAYKAQAQDDDKKGYTPLKQGFLSLPGENSEKGRIICMMVIFIILGIILGVTLGIFVLSWSSLTWTKPILIVVCILLFLFIPVPLHLVNNYYLGHIGERAVAEELDNLISQHDFSPRQWHFFHSFFPEEEDKGDIDHIIVCPKGVFCVETKTRRKKNNMENVVKFENDALIINGFSDNKALNQARGNAKRLKTFIEQKCNEKKFVKPIVAFPGWEVSSDITSDAKFFVINPNDFHAFFSNKPDTLNQEQIDKISQVIKDRNRSSLE